MRLYEINNTLRETYENYVNAETGEVDEHVASTLEQLEIAKEEKVEGCGIVYKEYLAEAAAIGEEIKVLKDRQLVAKHKADSLKRYLASNCAGEKYKTPRVTIGWRKSVSVEIDPLAVFHDVYTKTVTSPDKKVIKDALKEGEVIEGAELIERQNIQIK